MIRDVQRELQRNAELKEMHRTGVSLRKEISGVVEDFGKVSREVVDELSRLGDEEPVEPEDASNSSSKSNEMGANSEDLFMEEVEILRRSRKMSPAPSSQGSPGKEGDEPPAIGSAEKGKEDA